MISRLQYIDNLKSFLIILVVLGHVIQNSDSDFDHNIVFRYIYSFHMPLFMCVSGFVCCRPILSWGIVKKRCVQLMLPFLSWAFVNACWTGSLSVLAKNILHPDTALWFLWVLFFVTTLHIACLKIGEHWNVRSEYIIMVVIVVSYGIMIGWKFKLFGFQLIAWYFPFYCLGFYMHKYKTSIEEWLRKAMCPCFVLFLVLTYWWMRKDPPLFMNPSAGIIYNYIYKGGVALLASISLITLFNQIGGGKNAYISILGKETLGIYAIHLSLLELFYYWVEPYFGSFYMLSVILFSLFLLIISHFIYHLLLINRWTSFFLLGIKK